MLIVKIGGGDAIDVESLARELAELDRPLLIVHGANAARDRLAGQLQIPVQRVRSLSGQESVLSDASAIDLLLMSYAGLRNKRLVEALQRHGMNAIGLCGLDGAVIRARRNPGIRTERDGRKLLLRDLSGKPDRVNTSLLTLLLEHGYVPVLTVPLLDETGVAVNSENDDVVALLARELKASEVWMFLEARGLLREASDETSSIDTLLGDELAHWQSRVQGRMRRKLLALGRILDAGTESIRLGDGRSAHPVRDLLRGEGTRIQR